MCVNCRKTYYFPLLAQFSATMSSFTGIEFYWQKQQNRFLCHSLGDLGVHVVDFLLVLIELFCQLSRLRRYERILVNILVFERGWVTLSTNFRGKGGSSTNNAGCQKPRVPGLSLGVVCVILRLAVLIQYGRVTHRHTHTQTHDDG